MDRFFLDSFNLQSIQFLIEDLAQIHDDRFVDLLPQMGTEDLNERNLESGDLAVHENACQIQLHLDIGNDTTLVRFCCSTIR